VAKIIANWIINKKADINEVSHEELIKLIVSQSQKPTISDEELENVIKIVLGANPKAITDYKEGKQAALMFLVGLVMRELRGQGDAVTIRNLLEKALRNV